ncbi:MAG TPA: hypothetical protein VFN03_09615, partial [Trueperaceae bacterium]|nr:hypothetical protein [Trueperaceae bacterium]
GAVLPLVLLALLVIAAASFAMSFKVTLDAMAARSALSAAQAHAQAAGGLALAVAEHQAAVEGGTQPPPDHGPWPEHGISAFVRVTAVGVVETPGSETAGTEVPDGPVPVVTMVATATVGRATATTEATIVFLPSLAVLGRR